MDCIEERSKENYKAFPGNTSQGTEGDKIEEDTGAQPTEESFKPCMCLFSSFDDNS